MPPNSAPLLPCTKCNVELPIDSFPINGHRKDGSPSRRSYCKACLYAQIRAVAHRRVPRSRPFEALLAQIEAEPNAVGGVTTVAIGTRSLAIRPLTGLSLAQLRSMLKLARKVRAEAGEALITFGAPSLTESERAALSPREKVALQTAIVRASGFTDQ